MAALQNSGSTMEYTINTRIYGPGMKEDTNLASSTSYVIPIAISEEIARDMLDKLEAQKLSRKEAA
jgi:hypothetical protein